MSSGSATALTPKPAAGIADHLRMRKRTWSIIKWASLGTSIGSLVLAVLLMWTAEPKTPAEAPPEQAGGHRTEVDKPVIVERRHGRTVWELRAGEASQQASGAMHLDTPQLTLFTEAGKRVVITGKQAVFNPITRKLRFSHSVEVTYLDWRLQSERLDYESQRDEIVVPGRFQLSSPGLRASGKDLRLNRLREEVRVSGGIRIDDSNPQWTGSGTR